MKLFPQVLKEKQVSDPDHRVILWLGDKGVEENSYSYSQLASQVANLSKHLKSLGLRHGDRVVLSFPPGLEFFVAFLACITQGYIAVPVYPPGPATFKRDMERLETICEASGTHTVLTISSYETIVKALKWKTFLTGGGRIGSAVSWKSIPDSIFKDYNANQTLEIPQLQPADVAFLQFTSGSTGDPKGVMVTHGALAHNLTTFNQYAGKEKCTLVSWMPQYHDFGLILCMLGPVYCGYSAVLMSPMSFLKDPLLWLTTITKYKAKITGSPNFGYTRCVLAWNKLAPEKRPQIDLSSMRIASNGAEPIRPQTLYDFQDTFGPLGWGPKVMMPAYGLAEHVVYFCCMWTKGSVVDENGFVACGEVDNPINVKMGMEIVIMGSTGTVCEEGGTGEIWLHSGSVTAGYWQRPEKTEEDFGNMHDGKRWLATGDLGYIKEGLLYVTGRKKDVIIVNGRNFYPQDVELTVEKASSEVRPGCSAAFQLNTGLGGGEAMGREDIIGIAVEVRNHKMKPDEIDATARAICAKVMEEHRLIIGEIAFLKMRTIPKTTSGKIRRSTCKDQMIGKQLSIIPNGSWTQNLGGVASVEDAPSMGQETDPPNEGHLRDAANLRSGGSMKLLEGVNAPTPETMERAKLMNLVATATGIPLVQLDPAVALVELGIGSLQAVEMMGAVEDQYGVVISLDKIFEGQTLEELMDEVIEEAAASGATAAMSATDAFVASGPLELSYNQEQMYILHCMAADKKRESAYNIPVGLEFSGPLDVARLESALQKTWERHAAMRCRFSVKDGTPMAEYASKDEMQLPLRHQVVGAGKNGTTSLFEIPSIMQAVHDEICAPFDIFKGPLVRFLLIKASDTDYAMVITMHHIISDGWSVRVVLEDIAREYSAAENDGPTQQAAVPKAYPAFAQWQRNPENQASWGESLDYWKQQLKTAQLHLSLPVISAAAVATLGDAGPAKTIDFEMRPEIVGAMNAIAAKNGTTLFTTLVAALSALLVRYGNNEGLSILIPVANRDLTSGLMKSVGYYVNTVLLTFAPSEAMSFEEIVQQAKQVVLGAQKHSQVPYHRVVADALPRDCGSPQITFVLQDSRLMTISSFSNVETVPHFELLGEMGQLPLNIQMVVDSNGWLKGRITYRTEAFEHETVQDISGCLQSMFEQIVANPAAAISSFELLSEKNLEDLATMSMGVERPGYLSLPLAHEAFAKIAVDSPEKKCLCYEGVWLSYGEVNARANTLAGQLSALGVGPGVVVGLMLERSFELVVSILAVFKAGGCYLPCDPAYPDDRLSVYLEDGEALLVLVKSEHVDRAESLVPASVSVVDIETISTGSSALKPPGPEDPAYVIFTSGSTGRPKGVMVPHRGLRDHVQGSVEYYAMGSDGVGLLTITINFDPHLMQAFMPLVVGAGLVIATPEGHTNAAYIISVIKQQGVTHYNSTPSLALMQFAGEEARECTALRCVMFGGEQLPREVISLFAEKLPWCKVYNVYGPTEATITATELYCPVSLDFITIGRPVYNLQSFIVDAAMRPVPVGVPGELVLSGPRLALGYVGRPDLTEAAFIPNPCFDLIREKVAPELLPYCVKAYRTGDLVRWRSDGTIDFLGRIDRQVKITGVRIELGEVEGALESAVGVTQAVAAAVADPSGQKRLVGYVTPGDVDPAAVIAHCRSVLVPAMVPSVVLALESFPLLAGGKIDVKSLPAPDWSGGGEEGYEPPMDEVECAIQEIWMQVLDIEDPISVTVDFFAVGGNSLRIGPITALIRDELGVTLQATDVINHSTIRRLALFLEELSESSGNQRNLRSTTVASLRSLVLSDDRNPLLNRARTFIRRAEVTLLSAESTRLAELMPEPVRATQLPRPVYMCLQLLLSCMVTSLIPCIKILIGIIAAYWLYFGGSMVSLALVLPILYLVFAVVGSALILLAGKKALFPHGMKPGIHPLYGWTYLRWVTYRSLHTATAPVFFPYIRRSRLLPAFFRLMGATIGPKVVIDTDELYEPDLLVVGSHTTLAQQSSMSAAFVIPPNHVDEVGCLVLSFTRVGHGCTLGILANMQAGGHLKDDESLRPYGTMSQPNAVIEGDMSDDYPHFYPEHAMSQNASDWVGFIAAIFHSFCVVVSALLTITLFSACASKSAIVQALSDASLLYQACMVSIGVLFYLVIFSAIAAKTLLYGVIVFKRVILGPLTPGRNLKSNAATLFNYSLFRRMSTMPLVNVNSALRSLGLKIANQGTAEEIFSQAGSFMVEFDAITIKEAFTPGGRAIFQCVDSNGTIGSIEIGAFVSAGHNVFFPGCKIGDGCQLGNETPIASKKMIPSFHNVQGDGLFKMPKAKLPSLKASQTQTEQKTAISAIGSNFVELFFTDAFIYSIFTVFILNIGGVSLAVFSLPAAAGIRLLVLVAWMQHKLNSTGYKDIVKGGTSIQLGSVTHQRYLEGTRAIQAVGYASRFFVGTPWNTLFWKIVGVDIHPEAIVFTPLQIEFHLLKLGNACMAWASKVTTHYVKGGKLFFENVPLEDGAWVQGNTRVLVAKRIGRQARILPGAVTLPGEQIMAKQIWGGIPGAPVGTVLDPVVRKRRISREHSGRLRMASGRVLIKQETTRRRMSVLGKIDE